jgi:hypothetical protein
MVSLNSVRDGGEWSASSPAALLPTKELLYIKITDNIKENVKVKIKLSLCLNNEAPCNKNVWGVYIYIGPAFLISATDGDEWSASRPGRFTPGQTTPGVHFICGLAGPTAGLDITEKRKVFCSCRNLKSDSTIVYRVAWSLYLLSYLGFHETK